MAVKAVKLHLKLKQCISKAPFKVFSDGLKFIYSACFIKYYTTKCLSAQTLQLQNIHIFLSTAVLLGQTYSVTLLKYDFFLVCLNQGTIKMTRHYSCIPDKEKPLITGWRAELMHLLFFCTENSSSVSVYCTNITELVPMHVSDEPSMHYPPKACNTGKIRSVVRDFTVQNFKSLKEKRQKVEATQMLKHNTLISYEVMHWVILEVHTHNLSFSSIWRELK